MADNPLSSFWAELRRRKVIRVAVVYAVAGWVAVEAASVIFPALLFPEWMARMVVALALIGFPVAVGLAWAFAVRPEETSQPGGIDTAPEPSGEDRLDGWKRIAAYLNRDVRTVRRWEKHQDLPVRRLMHEKLATVYAYRSELDAWLQQRDTIASGKAQGRAKKQRPPARIWPWLAIPVVLLGGYAAVLWLSQDDAPIAMGEWDWVLVTHFDNRTGEEMLEGVVEFALQRELANSHFVKVVPQQRVNGALSLMKLPPESPIDVTIGREISLRDGGIKMLVTGRVEKLGNTYLISSQLVSPADGVTLASFSSEAPDNDMLLASVRKVAGQVRLALGESLGSIEASEQMLSKATTPSLEALKLYSEAERIMRGKERKRAVAILEQALRKDPDFASAHLLLVYMLRDRDEPQRAREHLQRAVELAEQTSERERLFILATYYRYLGDVPREIETYELLTRLYPDHTWANGNLGHLLAWRGRLADAYPYKIRNAESGPNDEWPQYNAAQFAIVNGERETAEHFVERAASIADYPWLSSRLRFFPAHAAWVEGDYAGAIRLAESIVSSMQPQELLSYGDLFGQVRSLFQTIGKLERMREISGMRTQLGWLDAVVAFDSGNQATLDLYLSESVEGFWDAALMSMAGRNEEARRMIDDPRSVETLRPPYMERDWRALAEGQVALSDGRFEEAVQLLSANSFYLSISARHAYQFSMHSLARAYIGLGQTDEAIETLELARRQGALTIFEPGAGWFWQRNLVLLHKIYHDSGLSAQAANVEAELRDLLQLSDAGHPFLQALEAQGPR